MYRKVVLAVDHVFGNARKHIMGPWRVEGSQPTAVLKKVIVKINT